jgi:uncharacterized protein (DUF934 family)
MKFIDHTPAHALLIDNTADVQTLPLAGVHAVALQFPKWVDGRAYSQAVTLRRRLHFRGEIVASGEVLVDMVPLLARTGFSAVQLLPGQSEAAARKALAAFERGHYQGDVNQTRPWFARGATV